MWVKALVKSSSQAQICVMKKALDICHNGYFSPLPARIKMGSFLALHSKNLVEL